MSDMTKEEQEALTKAIQEATDHLDAALAAALNGYLEEIGTPIDGHADGRMINKGAVLVAMAVLAYWAGTTMGDSIGVGLDQHLIESTFEDEFNKGLQAAKGRSAHDVPSGRMRMN